MVTKVQNAGDSSKQRFRVSCRKRLSTDSWYSNRYKMHPSFSRHRLYSNKAEFMQSLLFTGRNNYNFDQISRTYTSMMYNQ